jgi:hypothetical protein
MQNRIRKNKIFGYNKIIPISMLQVNKLVYEVFKPVGKVEELDNIIASFEENIANELYGEMIYIDFWKVDYIVEKSKNKYRYSSSSECDCGNSTTYTEIWNEKDYNLICKYEKHFTVKKYYDSIKLTSLLCGVKENPMDIHRNLINADKSDIKSLKTNRQYYLKVQKLLWEAQSNTNFIRNYERPRLIQTHLPCLYCGQIISIEDAIRNYIISNFRRFNPAKNNIYSRYAIEKKILLHQLFDQSFVGSEIICLYCLECTRNKNQRKVVEYSSEIHDEEFNKMISHTVKDYNFKDVELSPNNAKLSGDILIQIREKMDKFDQEISEGIYDISNYDAEILKCDEQIILEKLSNPNLFTYDAYSILMLQHQYKDYKRINFSNEEIQAKKLQIFGTDILLQKYDRVVKYGATEYYTLKYPGKENTLYYSRSKKKFY